MKNIKVINMSEHDFIAFKGNKLIYAQAQNAKNEAVSFSKTLSKHDIQMLDENPGLFNCPEKLYWLISGNHKYILQKMT